MGDDRRIEVVKEFATELLAALAEEHEDEQTKEGAMLLRKYLIRIGYMGEIQESDIHPLLVLPGLVYIFFHHFDINVFDGENTILDKLKEAGVKSDSAEFEDLGKN